MNRPFKAALMAIPLLALLAGCSTQKPATQHSSSSRYSMSQDTAPAGDFDASDLADAVPTAEPYSRGGNRSPYSVWGKSYTVMENGSGYQATGIASWYGAKFHGHKTSNGEVYDMYEMSAAHRSLPLPTFVQVTNLANNRQVIVRVNDRGPFHSDRIIDLSYAAAKKLGFMDKGTARVRLAAISVKPDGSWAAAGSAPLQPAGPAPLEAGTSIRQLAYVQVGAFRSVSAAEAFQRQVRAVTEAPVVVHSADKGGWHRVHVGPFDDRTGAERERARIEARRMGQPIIVMRGDGT